MIWEPQRIVRSGSRVVDIAKVLSRYGFGDVVRRLELTDLLDRAGRALHWEEAPELGRLKPPERVRRAMEELGPSFVKLGQIMATRVDLFPPDWIAEFEKLHSHAPPVPFEDLRPQLEEDLGKPPEEVFDELELEPVGAASIAQVHRARLKSGVRVILKIRRPGIKPTIQADLDLLTYLADLAEERIPDAGLYRPRELVHQFASSMRRELDLANECRNAERAAGNLPEDSPLVIPQVYWEWTCERLNVQQHIDGIPGREYPILPDREMDPKRIAREGARAIARTVIEDGFFHADPHPGNIFFLPGHRIALVDWGMVGRLSEQRRHEVVDLVLGIVERDHRRVTDILLEWTQATEPDMSRLTSDVEAFCDQLYDTPLKRLDIEQLFTELTRLLRRHGLALPPDLAMMIKAFVTLEGVGRQLDPEFDLVQEAKPVVQKAVLRRYSPKALIRRGRRLFAEMFDLAMGLPRDTRDLLKAIRSGSLRHRLKIDGLEDLADRVDAAATRLAVSLVTSALILGTSIVIAAGEGPEILGIPVFHLFGLGAMISGFWMLVSIWRKRG